MRNNTSKSILEFGSMVQMEMPFKGISYLEFWQAALLCNFGRAYYEEQLCEIILDWVSGSGDVV